MSRPIIRIHNITTNEVIDREMNDAEFAQYEAEQAANAIAKAEAEATAAAKAALTSTTRHYRRTSKTFTFLIKEHCGWS
jgi:hypothetical protein